MQELIIAFIIWSMVGIVFVCLGIHAFEAKKTVGFWANAKTFEVKDVKKYNRAVGKLIETITVMIVYVTVIEKKYRKSERSYR